MSFCLLLVQIGKRTFKVPDETCAKKGHPGRLVTEKDSLSSEPEAIDSIAFLQPDPTQ